MYVLTVELRIKPEHVDSFRETIERQARTSLENEEDCHDFQVSVSVEDPFLFLLYEVYSDKAAFEAHVAMPYSKESGAMTKPWIESTAIRVWQRR